MTRGILVTSCSEELGLDTTAAGAELAAMQRWANEAVLDVLTKTRCRVQLGDLTLVVNEGDYRLDVDILALTEAFLPSGTTKLIIVGLQDILELRRVNASVPSGYGVRRLAIEGSFAMVWPIPTSAEVIRYVFVPKPTAMTSDAHDPATITYGGIPEEYHESLLLYMNWKGARADGAKPPHTPKEYHDLYRESLVDIKKAHAHKSDTRGRLRPARVGYPDWPAGPRRNDVY